MRKQTTLAAILALPLLLMACNRADNSPTAAAPGQTQEKQAMSPDKEFERSPPAAGVPAGQPSTGMVPGQPATAPTTEGKTPPATTPAEEPKKSY